MPQISQILETYASQFFWMLITFGLIYFGIAKMMLPKVEATVDARDKKIADDLAAAERAKTDAHAMEAGGDGEMLAARADAMAKSNEAKAKAAKETAATLASADSEILVKLSAAEAALHAVRDKAMANIEAVAADAAADILAKIAGIKINAVQAATAVKAVMANG